MKLLQVESERKKKESEVAEEYTPRLKLSRSMKTFLNITYYNCNNFSFIVHLTGRKEAIKNSFCRNSVVILCWSSRQGCYDLLTGIYMFATIDFTIEIF